MGRLMSFQKDAELMAHILTKSTVNAICFFDLWVEEALVVGLHRDAMLGANGYTG